MKHVYPPRHPASLDAADVSTSASSGPASATPRRKDVGRQADRNATDGAAVTDRGPMADQAYDEKAAPDRGPTEPRR